MPSHLRCDGASLAFDSGSPRQPLSIVQLDLATGATTIRQQAAQVAVDPAYFSTPEPITFPTEGGAEAHGLFWPPCNPDAEAPADELPPLIVYSHGGPTSAVGSTLALEVQYWTSRGIGYLAVNYGGSSGLGREYRQRLNGNWGVVDVDDCINGAQHLVRAGRVDGERLLITGGSAGGYTTLCALTMRKAFAAGSSHFGLADLEPFVSDTHKFESRYLDSLVGPYPEARELYRQRSPIHFVDSISVPLIVLQGLEDRIVPPNQAEMIVAAVRAKGLPCAYLAFAGEQHGWRRAETIVRVLEAELYFLGRVFGFTPHDSLEPVAIENLA
jgi:dipeptidyl aminopeptidase/acylaminoacyl peptidase